VRPVPPGLRLGLSIDQYLFPNREGSRCIDCGCFVWDLSQVGRAEGKKKHTDSVTGKKLGKNRDEEKGGADGYKGMERVKEAGGKGGAGDTGGKGNSAGQEVGHKRGAADVAVAPATKKINTAKYFNERD
jgi:hypothetical protein